MFHESVAPQLRSLVTGVVRYRCLQSFGVPESVIGERLAVLMAPGHNPEVATQAREGIITVRITATADKESESLALLCDAERFVCEQLGEGIYSREEVSLADAVAPLLSRHGQTIALAESCTGGAIADALTDIPGISRSLLECAVTYSDEAKVNRLSVPAGLISEHGAVSAEVAKAMAKGIRTSSGADIGLAVTGIAGPDGGTAAKPVGLVYVALADRRHVMVEELRLVGGRRQIKSRAANYALNILRLHLERLSFCNG